MKTDNDRAQAHIEATARQIATDEAVLGMTPTNDKVDQSGADALMKIDKALQTVSDLCQGSKRWIMNVPVNQDDPDIVIAGALHAARAALQAQIAQAVPLMYGIIDKNGDAYLDDPESTCVGSIEDDLYAVVYQLNGGKDAGDFKAVPLYAAPQQAVAESSEPVPDQEEDAYVINRLATILADVAIALKGEELSLHRHSYHDLPDVARALKLEVELHRMQEDERQASTNQPVQAKALTDEQIVALALEYDVICTRRGIAAHTGKIDFARALLASQPSANLVPSLMMVPSTQADVAAVRDAQLDGSRPLPFTRDELGLMVRQAWVKWAETQSSPKPSWLVPYAELSEADKEADRQIGETVARLTLIMDAGNHAVFSKSATPTAQPQADGVKP